MSYASEIYLVDNGSLRPEAVRGLRSLAARLSFRLGLKVRAVSLLHAHKIDPSDLDGVPAPIVKTALRESLAGGVRRIFFLPLFLGPSRAITEYLPQLIDEARADNSGFVGRIALPLAGDDPEQPDPRLARMLADYVRASVSESNFQSIVLVDHGSPVEAVATVRNSVAAQMGALLGRPVLASSMERREGPEYAFNEPLLERMYEVDPSAGGSLLAALFFLLPGRHAGPEGDIARMLGGLVARGAYTQAEITPLLSEHPLLLEILEDRLKSVLQAEA
ncbi:sirohydrochlorin chelatase [Coraliomargarita parva]|uniref:sirohydrochlorin chelatase n=1 Tax=Coraliomargarita parva TaxID=3014050 RepID=UPI0022B34E71|nr:hypothetical protein [Coraliomargarita parva]